MIKAGALFDRALLLIGPWRRLVWAALSGNASSYAVAARQRFLCLVERNLCSFTAGKGEDLEEELKHCVSRVTELAYLLDDDPDYLGRYMILSPLNRHDQRAAIDAIDWLAHRVACLIMVHRRPMRLLGQIFVAPSCLSTNAVSLHDLISKAYYAREA